ncbi:MAG: glycosyltransferase family 4 protein [Bacteroidaceae bacterium]|nr:glycosyltransferase family 4 protein [Bacteroidaceae bacterium]
MKKLRVAYILNTTKPHNGATKAILRLTAHLKTMGVSPLYVLPDDQGICNELREQGDDVVVINYRPYIYPPLFTFKDYLLAPLRTLGRIYLCWKASRQLVPVLVREHVQLVHTNSSIINIGYRAALRLKLPHVFHIREYADLDFRMYYIPTPSLYHRWLRRSHTICITRGIQHHHDLDVPTAMAHSQVIYDGVLPHSESLPPLTDGSNGAPYFLFAGRVEPAKCLDYLLEGYAQYVHSSSLPLPLLVAGAHNVPSYLERIKSFLRTHQLESHVQLLGERPDILKLMEHARATIIPSAFEGFGFCMAEAMFQGCLVIGRNTAGTREQFDNGFQLQGQEIGFRFETPEQLAHCLSQVTSMPKEQYATLRERAFATVNQLYTSQASAKNVYDFYQKILT